MKCQAEHEYAYYKCIRQIYPDYLIQSEEEDSKSNPDLEIPVGNYKETF